MRIEKQIKELEKSSLVGGLDWEVVYPTDCEKDGYIWFWSEIEVFCDMRIYVAYFTNEKTFQFGLEPAGGPDGWIFSQDLKSTTLNEALLETVDIIKTKLIESVNSMGLLCFYYGHPIG